jgi:hypothetical protein
MLFEAYVDPNWPNTPKLSQALQTLPVPASEYYAVHMPMYFGDIWTAAIDALSIADEVINA